MGPWSIPQGFDRLVSDHLRATRGDDDYGISARDFPAGQSVMVTFDDGSFAHFQFAFVVRDHERKLVAVFTEHCGYHVFSSAGATFAVLRQAAEVTPAGG